MHMEQTVKLNFADHHSNIAHHCFATVSEVPEQYFIITFNFRFTVFVQISMLRNESCQAALPRKIMLSFQTLDSHESHYED